MRQRTKRSKGSILSAAALAHIAGAILSALEELKRACDRSHGNLKASNVLIGPGELDRAVVVLSDPAPATVAAKGGEAVRIPLHRPAFLGGVLSPGEQVMGFALPVKDVMGDRIGTLSALVSSAYLGKILARFSTGQPGALDSLAVLTDGGGRPVILPEGVAWDTGSLTIAGKQWQGPGGAHFLVSQTGVSGDASAFGWKVAAMKTLATLEAPVTRMSRRLLWALLLRCPDCGGRPLFRDWAVMTQRCPVCALKLDRGEEDYFLGGYVINFVGAELVIVALAVAVAIATWPDVPWTEVGWGLAVLMLVFPFITYPFSKTLFLAIDLIFRPPSEEDFSE